MPEIAEVETVRRVLKKEILHKKIKEVKVLYAGIIESNLEDFQKNLPGEEFIDIKRKGKWLILELTHYFLLSHLRMEGKFFLKKASSPIEKHEHVIITFTDNTSLRYQDTRKFGKMNLVLKSDIDKVPSLLKQGIEPLDENLTREYIYEKIKNKNIPIKTLLLDQSIISGLGNIYANEVLFASKINPHKLGKELTIDECEKIVLSSNQIIEKAITLGGTTIKSYTSSLGVTGHYQDYLKVHKQSICPSCNKPLTIQKIGGRSTYYCLHCQK